MNYFTKDTELGKITIAEDKGFVTNLMFEVKKLSGNNILTPIIEQAFIQLDEYLNSKRTSFDIPLNPAGTHFQQKVWSILYSIPYGTTSTYKEIANKIGQPEASRAIGMANNKNPIPIFIPCHRVISSDGSLNGYSGGKDMKKKLLNIESGINKS